MKLFVDAYLFPDFWLVMLGFLGAAAAQNERWAYCPVRCWPSPQPVHHTIGFFSCHWFFELWAASGCKMLACLFLWTLGTAVELWVLSAVCFMFSHCNFMSLHRIIAGKSLVVSLEICYYDVATANKEEKEKGSSLSYIASAVQTEIRYIFSTLKK